MIIFVGDKPSSKNKDPNVAFVGTPSYKRLLGWLYELDLSVNDVLLCNSDEVKIYGQRFLSVQTKTHFIDVENEDIFIFLGENAGKTAKKLKFEEKGIKHTTVPHPSPRNRIWNDPNVETKLLWEIKQWLITV